mmetsp:Transcript_12809/g.30438  ORF Transcript_12809/g.30438 Transcript_12809/m.30438 type:complete len:233 (-) Transcript_12809:39-737(-)
MRAAHAAGGHLKADYPTAGRCPVFGCKDRSHRARAAARTRGEGRTREAAGKDKSPLRRDATEQRYFGSYPGLLRGSAQAAESWLRAPGPRFARSLVETCSQFLRQFRSRELGFGYHLRPRDGRREAQQRWQVLHEKLGKQGEEHAEGVWRRKLSSCPAVVLRLARSGKQASNCGSDFAAQPVRRRLKGGSRGSCRGSSSRGVAQTTRPAPLGAAPGVAATVDLAVVLTWISL